MPHVVFAQPPMEALWPGHRIRAGLCRPHGRPAGGDRVPHPRPRPEAPPAAAAQGVAHAWGKGGTSYQAHLGTRSEM